MSDRRVVAKQGVIMGADRWLSVGEIAEHLGVSRDTVYTWVNERGMPAHKVGKLWKFQIKEVDQWIRSDRSKESNSDRKQH